MALKVDSINTNIAAVGNDEYYQGFVKKYGRMYPLPSETTAVFVHWEHNHYYKISVALGAKERTIKAQWYNVGGKFDEIREVNIKSPPVILTNYIHYENFEPESTLEIWEHDTSYKGAIRTRPYMISNVHGGGEPRICFGGKRIKNLRQANSMFWNGPFNPELLPPNNDPWPWWHNGRCDKIEEHVNKRCGLKNPSRLHNHRRVNKICKCSEEMSSGCACGRCSAPGRQSPRPSRTSPLFCRRCNGFISDNEEDKQRMQAALDAVGSVCICCAGFECNCKCDCDCCNNSCNCPCTCNLSENYYKYLETYNGDDYGLRWRNNTENFLGGLYKDRQNRKYLSFPGNAIGLFVSRDKTFIEEYANEFKKNHRSMGDVVFGLLRELDAETYLLMLGKEKVIPVKKYRIDS